MTSIVRGILATLVAIIALGAWAVIGLFYWIPLLARTCAAFTSKMMIAAIANKPGSAAGKDLDDAFQFYIRGFTRIWHPIGTLYTAHLPEPEEDANEAIFTKENVREFFVRMAIVLWQTAIAVLFWAAIGFLFFPEARDRLHFADAAPPSPQLLGLSD